MYFVCVLCVHNKKFITVGNLEIKCFVLLKMKSTETFLPAKLCEW